MKWQNTPKISENIHLVGVKDWNRRLFDALIPLPKGTSYNSYLVKGKEKKALIDTVNPGFEKDWEEKIAEIMDPRDIDYLIMNHAEPDHAGAISHMMSINAKVKLVATSKGAKMAKTFFNVPEERIKTVQDQEKIDLGGKTLQLIEAPMLHWPETMFTYLLEDKILFSCDFFGSHVAAGLYDDEIEDLLVHAKRYWGEIMMPYRVMAQSALKKIENLEIKMIAPSHGPIHRNVERIMNAYKRWANGETGKKVMLAYVSMWNSTEKMIQPFIETLASEGIETVLYNLAVADIGEVAKDLVDSRAIVLGTPTVLGMAHPLAIYAAYLVRALRPPLKFAVFLSSYGWGGGAIKSLQEVLGQSKIDVLEAIEINGPPKEEDIIHIVETAKTLAKKVKEE